MSSSRKITSSAAAATKTKDEEITQSTIDDIIQYYSDAGAKHRAPRKDDGSIVLRFGEVVQGRKTPPVSLWVKNVHPQHYNIRLTPETTDGDLKFAKAPPDVLKPGQVAEIQLVFECPINRITPLMANWGMNLTVLAPVEEGGTDESPTPTT